MERASLRGADGRTSRGHGAGRGGACPRHGGPEAAVKSVTRGDTAVTYAASDGAVRRAGGLAPWRRWDAAEGGVSRDGQSLGGHSRPDICLPYRRSGPLGGGEERSARPPLRPGAARAHQRPHAASLFAAAASAVPADVVHPSGLAFRLGEPREVTDEGEASDGAHLRQLPVRQPLRDGGGDQPVRIPPAEPSKKRFRWGRGGAAK